MGSCDDKLPRADGRMLAAWLSASPLSLGPFASALAAPLAPPPPSIRVLVPEPFAVCATISLGRLLGGGSELLLLLAEDEWAAALHAHAELRAVAWMPAERRHEPPWYVQVSLITSLLAPLPAAEARPFGSAGALVTVCHTEGGLLDPRAGAHVLGLFDRALDRGGFCRRPDENRPEYACRLGALLAPGARALVLSAERIGGGEQAGGRDATGSEARSPKRARAGGGGGGASRDVVPASADALARALALGSASAAQAQLYAVHHCGRSARCVARRAECGGARRAGLDGRLSEPAEPVPVAEAEELWCGHTHYLLKADAGQMRAPVVPACPCCR